MPAQLNVALNSVQRASLVTLTNQVDGAIDFIERLQRAHAAIAPRSTIPIDAAVLHALEGFVLGPIRLGLRVVREAGVVTDEMTLAEKNLESGHTGTGALLKYLTALGCMRAVILGVLASPEPSIVAAAEIAFAHLQRLLVVDSNLREAWSAALDKHERPCEQLGGAHLLLHGLWGFKTEATGERSDLVLGEHVSAISKSSLDAARGLILTEWKRITDPGKTGSLVKKARDQLALYSGGSLAALELRSVRYVVLISRKRLPAIDDVEASEFRIRHVNIAVEPDTPGA